MAKLNNTQKVTGGIAGAIALIMAGIFTGEGGYVNDPHDPGGETNKGITKKVAVANGYTAPMKDLTTETAKSIYEKNYIEQPNIIPIIRLSLAVGHKLSDQGVNVGTGTSAKWIQRSLNSLNYKGYLGTDLKVDGIIGKATIDAYQKLISKRGQDTACTTVLKMLDSLQGYHYISLAEKNTTYRRYTQGWIDKRVGNVPKDECYPVTD